MKAHVVILLSLVPDGLGGLYSGTFATDLPHLDLSSYFYGILWLHVLHFQTKSCIPIYYLVNIVNPFLRRLPLML